MLPILFNGRVQVSYIVRSGFSFHIKLTSFVDATQHFTAKDVKIGDVLFIRGFNNRAYRLVITAIQAKNAGSIECDVVDESQTLNVAFPLQKAALVRETPNWKYPMFPVGIPAVLEKLMLDWYAILADRITEGGNGGGGNALCPGNLITHTQVVGTETVCLENADGTKSKITLAELKEYFLTLNTEGGNIYRLDVSNNGFMNNQDKTPVVP